VLNRRDLAGKTGTTNEQRDAWFNGYNQSIVTTMWVGFDNNNKLGRGEVGGKAALPGWIHFMQAALDNYRDAPPIMPDGMLTIRIDPETGKLASIDQKDAIFEIFRAGHEPTERAAVTENISSPENSGTPEGTRPARAAEELF
jgi:penicillin-binding protein 1A